MKLMFVFLILLYAIQMLSIQAFLVCFNNNNNNNSSFFRSVEFFQPKLSAGTTFLKKRDHNTVNFSVNRNKQNMYP